MALLFIICIIFFIASLGFGIFYVIKGFVKKEFSYVKTGLICLGIALVSVILPLWNVASDIPEAFSN